MSPLDAADFRRALDRLASRDPALARVLEAHGRPGFWHRPAGFASLCLFIVEQQVSLVSAKAVFERLVGELGTVIPETVLDAPVELLGRVGLTRQKQRYLKELAGTVASGSLDLDSLADLPDAEVKETLELVPGIGRWTADVYLLSCLRRPDVWPTGDRALQVGTGEVLATPPPTKQQLAEIGERWRPYRSVAARLIWHSYLTRRGREETTVRGIGSIPGTEPAPDYRSAP